MRVGVGLQRYDDLGSEGEKQEIEGEVTDINRGDTNSPGSEKSRGRSRSLHQGTGCPRGTEEVAGVAVLVWRWSTSTTLGCPLRAARCCAVGLRLRGGAWNVGCR